MWNKNPFDRSDDIRVQISRGMYVAADDNLVEEWVCPLASAKLSPFLLQQAGIALPSGEILPLQFAPGAKGIVLAGPAFPFWLRPGKDCEFKLCRQRLCDLIADRRYEGAVSLVAVFVDMSGVPYYSEPYELDPALPNQWRMSDEELAQRRAYEAKLLRESEQS
ncbi:hypothetical protein CCAX7_55620 [Capsulimonas corticalis]|uniref:Uncharacterized protein n=1 Tax=Capsulimonas corticalis TaxID=2219043 RepID=A0A402D0X9_9BACT|nr:hypothetical protein [Capsulimonas corticalis]BDI33511.1 hypothetical protein CCAX7_55620 [Capsulimonas corticalis]